MCAHNNMLISLHFLSLQQHYGDDDEEEENRKKRAKFGFILDEAEVDEDEDDDDYEDAEEGYKDLIDNKSLHEGPSARDIEGKRRLEMMLAK